MAYNRQLIANFGPAYTGLATVGYAIKDSSGSVVSARTTTGVSEIQSGTGSYRVLASIPDGTQGFVVWDTGGSTPVYAFEEINPRGVSENLDAKVSSVSGGGGLTISDVQTALTNQGYTSARAPYLDRVNTALPNAAPNASGGLPTFGTGTGQINPSGGKVPATLNVADVTGTLSVNTTQIGGTTQTAKDLGALNVTQINTLASHDPGATLGTSTYSGADTPGTTTLLTRIPSTLTITGGKVTVNPTTGALDGIVPNSAFFANAPSGGGGGGGGTTVNFSIPAAVAGYTPPAGDLPPIRRGDTYSAQIAGLGTITARTKLWITAKQSDTQADSKSLFQITESGGLIVLAGSTALSTFGSLTVDDASLGNVTVALGAGATYLLSPGTYAFDIQMLTPSGVTTLTVGNVRVVGDITKAIA